MGKIHVNRNREMLGQFTREEVEDGLKSGRFLPTDLAWREPMETWVPLSEFPDFSVSREEETAPAEEVIPPPLAVSPAWERRSEVGFFPAVLETVWQILGAPVTAFRQMKTDGGLGTPLLFFLIVGGICQCIGITYSLIINSVSKVNTMQQTQEIPPFLLYLEHHPAVYFLILPFSMLFSIFMGAGLLHLCLMVLGGANKPFETTFRVYAYAMGAGAALMVIPLCGGILQLVYLPILFCIGLKEAHQTTYLRAIVAFVIPLILCCTAISGTIAIGTIANLHNLK
jgi:hypothetical protein